jgi:hypothetical protein
MNIAADDTESPGRIAALQSGLRELGILLRRTLSGNGTKRTSRQAQPMSAFGGKADIGLTPRNVR